MKIGVGIGPRDIYKIEYAANAGYDYVEVALNGFAELSDEDYAAFRKALKDNNIVCEAANCLFPGTIHLCDETFDEKQVEEYLEKAFARAQETGMKVVVFGSGGSRKIPEGFCREKAVEQITTVCTKYLEPIAKKYGICVVIEPLNKKETNIFNTVEETAAFVKKLGLKNVKCLADSYHMDMEKEPYKNILLAGKDLAHAHIANPDGRILPKSTDANDYTEFFASLVEIGYTGRLSAEWSDEPKAPYSDYEAAAKFLRDRT